MVKTLLTALEALCVLAVLYGVALVYVPAAVILAGLCGVVAIEAASRPRRKGAP